MSPPPGSIEELITVINQDISSNGGSNFAKELSIYQETVNTLHETFESDKATLVKIKKCLKSFSASGNEHVTKQLALCDVLDSISDTGLHPDLEVELQEIGSGICKYSVVLRNLALRYQTQMKQLSNFLLFPLNTCLKDTLGHDIRKPFDKALKDLNTKMEKVRKDRVQAAKEAGKPKPNPENLIQSEDVEREKKALQLHLCEYLIGVNELHSKKGAEFLLHLIDFFQLQRHYFQEGKETMEHLSIFLTDLQDKVSAYKSNQDEQKRALITIKDDLKRWQQVNSSRNSVLLDNSNLPFPSGGSTAGNGISTTTGYSIHQRRPPPIEGSGRQQTGQETEIEGVLYKRSESKVKRQWLKRRVAVRQGQLFLYHGDKEKKPIALPLLTCQLKDIHQSSTDSTSMPMGSGNIDGDSTNSLCFDLVSNNRTYHFMAEREFDKRNWMTVIENAREQVFQTAMHSTPSTVSQTSGSPNQLFHNNQHRRQHSSGTQLSIDGGLSIDLHSTSTSNSHHLTYSQQKFVEKIRALPGNNICADCDCKEPDWVSINLGILICLECCGVHREMGVHLSRTQSLAIDNLSPIEMLLPRFIGNSTFNEVFEATMLTNDKPCFAKCNNVDDIKGMHIRKTFIMAKYKEKKFVNRVVSLDQNDLYHDLLISVRQASVAGIIQVYGEQCELLRPLPDSIDDEQCLLNNTALHSAIYYGGFSLDSGSTFAGLECDRAEPNNLACIAFLLQNSSNSSYLYHANRLGENVLHYCAKYDHPEAMKLIMKACGMSNKMLTMLNNEGQTPQVVAAQRGHVTCVNLLQHLTDMIVQQENSRLNSASHSSSTSVPSSHNWAFVMDLNTTWFESDEEEAMQDVGTVTPVAQSSFPVASSRRSCLHESLHGKESSQTLKAHSASFNYNSNNVVGKGNNKESVPSPTSNQRVAGFFARQKTDSVSSNTNNSNAAAATTTTTITTTGSFCTMPRKKNPAPPPPPPLSSAPTPAPAQTNSSTPLRSYSKIDSTTSPPVVAASVLTPSLSLSSSSSASSSSVVRPPVAPKPRLSPPSSMSQSAGGGEDNSSCYLVSQTLPRRLSSSTNRRVEDSSTLLHPLKESEDDENDNNVPFRRLHSNQSQSSEHINVLLDVLEEPAPYLTLNPRLSKRNASDTPEFTTSQTVPPSSTTATTTTSPIQQPVPLPRSPAIQQNTKDVNAIVNKSSSNIITSPLSVVGGLRRVRALYDCDAESEEDLDFRKGDVLIITATAFPNWWVGYMEKNPGKSGIFPANYVEDIAN